MTDSVRVSFDEFAALLRHSDKIDDTDIRVTSCSASPSDETLHITSNLTLTFDSSLSFSCRSLIVTDCDVEIHDLSLLGALSVRNGSLKLINSRLRNPPADCDYILEATGNSKVCAISCSFGDTERYGLCVDDHSFLSLEKCSVTNVEFFAVSLTGGSVGLFNDCLFADSRHDLLYTDSDSSLSLWKCSITGASRLGLSAGFMCSVSIVDSTIDHCQSGCVGASNSERIVVTDCHFLDSLHSAVLLENTTAMFKRTVIANCHGNAINANRRTKLIASRCTFQHTTYPSLALCDGALGYIKKCTIRDSEMSGIIVRNRSRASIKRCTIENVKQTGIVVSDSRDVSIVSSFVFNCEESAICCYNHSEVSIRSSFLVGPSKVGINVFTGAAVDATGTTIAGMRDVGVWLHHGGSGRFASTLLHTIACETKDALVEQIKTLPLMDHTAEIDENRLFRIETARPVVATACFVVGRGIIDIIRSADAEEAERGARAVACSCQGCGKPVTDCYFSVCAHSLFCKACWDALEEKPVRCPLCLLGIGKVVVPIDVSHDDERTCGICLSEPADAIIVPCGHLICAECGQSWFEQHSECPYCREPCGKCRQFVSYA
jgi:hypothetical protein